MQRIWKRSMSNYLAVPHLVAILSPSRGCRILQPHNPRSGTRAACRSSGRPQQEWCFRVPKSLGKEKSKIEADDVMRSLLKITVLCAYMLS